MEAWFISVERLFFSSSTFLSYTSGHRAQRSEPKIKRLLKIRAAGFVTPHRFFTEFYEFSGRIFGKSGKVTGFSFNAFDRLFTNR
jgi:hypothetical protein